MPRTVCFIFRSGFKVVRTEQFVVVNVHKKKEI